MPPPLPPKKIASPKWARDIGAVLKEDAGGKYYEMEHVVVTKVYVYPNFKVEMPNGKSYCKKPYGYKNKTQSRKDNAVDIVSNNKNEEPIVQARKEEW